MKELVEVLQLMIYAIERNTINTWEVQGKVSATEILDTLANAKKKIEDTLNMEE